MKFLYKEKKVRRMVWRKGQVEKKDAEVYEKLIDRDISHLGEKDSPSEGTRARAARTSNPVATRAVYICFNMKLK